MWRQSILRSPLRFFPKATILPSSMPMLQLDNLPLTKARPQRQAPCVISFLVTRPRGLCSAKISPSKR